MDQGNAKTDLGLALSSKARRTREAPISALIAAALGNPDLISFAAGLVDPLTLPAEECLEITRRLFSDRGRAQVALQYDTTMGLRPLRHELLKHIERLEGRAASEFGVSENDIVVSTGSQQMLYLVGDCLIDPGDIVIAGNPSYFVFAGTLASLGARVIGVPLDEHGMDVDAVDRVLGGITAEGNLHRVKFVYCTSFFDNPTGLTLSLARRQQLMEVVKAYSRKHRILILEDAAYRELRYDGEALPSIKSFDRDNEHVALTQTFSKPFAPGIKLGYTLLPKGLLDAVLRQKGNHDFGSSNLCQHIALEALRDGSYLKHVEVIKEAYRKKRDAMVEALEEHMPRFAGVSWTYPAGGMYVWLTLPGETDTSREGKLFEHCLHRGVLYVPGEFAFGPDEQGQIPRNHLRLTFGHVALEKIEPGIARLAESVKSLLSAGPATTMGPLAAPLS